MAEGIQKEGVEFVVQAPVVPLPGLDAAIAKLRTLTAYQALVTSGFKGMKALTLPELDASTIEARLKATFGKVTELRKRAASDVAGAIFGPDFGAAFANSLKALKRDFAGAFSGGNFTGIERATDVLSAFSKQLNAANAATASQLANFLGVAGGGNLPAQPKATSVALAGAVAAGPGGTAVLEVPPGNLRALLGAGQVLLEVPAERIQAVLTGGSVPVAGGAAGAGGDGSGNGARRRGSGAGGGGGGGAVIFQDGAGLAEAVSPAEAANELRRRIRRTQSSATTLVTRAGALGERIGELYDETGVKLVAETRTLPKLDGRLRELQGRIGSRLAQAEAEIASALARTPGNKKSEKKRPLDARAAAYGSASSDILGFLDGGTRGSLAEAGLGKELAALEKAASATALKAAAARAQAEVVASREAAAASRSRLAALKGRLDEQARADGAERARNTRVAALDGRREQAAGDEAKARVAKAELARREQVREAELAVVAAQLRAGEARLLEGGFTLAGTRRSQGLRRGGNTGVETRTFTRESEGQVERAQIRVGLRDGKVASAEFDEVARAMNRATREAQALKDSALENTLRVSKWAASVGILYGALGLATGAVSTLVDTSLQGRRLEVVFQGTAAEARGLLKDTAALAGAEGRLTTEANEATIAWARLGDTRRRTAEGSRVSLVAANVADVDAALATKQLQASAKAYGIEVQNLSGFLGVLNETSNNYNVTTADLLEGFSRAAQAARDVGLGYAELTGLVGAGVGATGQTGANIGNSIKSIIGSLSSPDLTRKLKDNFSLNVVGDNGEAKVFGEVLGDLFSKYQAVSKEEQRHLGYLVAGKTQLARFNALMDQYVRAQVLAINAQLNLNSAEEENLKIRGSLKNQLAAIGAEAQRLVVLQGGRGPGQALGFVAESIKNVLRVANTDVGSGLLTGFAGLLTVVAGRALTAGGGLAAMAGQGTFLGNTLKGVSGVLGGLRGALVQSAIQMLDNVRNMTALKAAGAALTTGPGALQVVRGGRQIGANVSAGAASGAVGLAAAGAAGGLGNILAGGAKAAVGALAAVFGELALVLGAVGVGFYAFNRVMEDAGRSSDAANRKLAGFNGALEAAKGRAEAAGTAVALVDRLAKTVSGVTDPARRKALLEPLGSLAGAFGISKEEIALAQENLRRARTVGEAAEALAGIRRRVGGAGAEARQEAFSQRRQALEAAQGELERLRGKGTASRELVAQAEANVLSLSQQVVESRLDEDDALDRALGSEEKRERAQERQKELLSAQADILALLATSDDAVTKSSARVGQLEAELGLLREQEAAANGVLRVEGERTVEVAGRVAALRAEADRERGEVERLVRQRDKSRLGNGSTLDGAFSGLIGAAAGRADRLEGQAKALEVGARSPEADAAERTRVAARNRAEAAREELARLSARSALDQVAGQVSTARRVAGAGLGGLNVGESQGEQLVARLAGLDGLRARALAEVNDERLTEIDRLRALGRAAEYMAQADAAGLELAQRRGAVEAEISNTLRERTREANRALLTAGPEELLRKLAARSLVSGGAGVGAGPGGGLSAGQFFAAGELRGEILNLPGFGERERALERERRGLAGVNGDPRALEAQLNASASLTQQLQGAAAAILSPLQAAISRIVEPGALAAAQLANLSGAAGAVTASLTALDGRLRGLLGGGGGGTNGAPFNAQAAGVF